MKIAPESRNFCILPWTHLSLGVSGSLHPCCKSDHYSYGTLQTEGFEAIWNGAAAREMRKKLLAGEAPTQCSDCHLADEKVGVRSLRQRANGYFADSFASVRETAPDGSVPASSINYLHLRFSNLCNFRCRICDASKSSGWTNDARKLGESIATRTVSLGDASARAWSMIEAVLPQLRRIYFTGGEPLLHEEHYEVLEKLIALGRTDILLDYNINLSTLSYGDKDALSLWAHFKKVYIAVSLDGVGRQAGFLRKGMDWESSKVHFKQLRVFAPHARIIVNPTLCAMNLFHITTAIDEWIQLGMIREPWALRFSFLTNPAHYQIRILNEEEREALRRHYAGYLADLRTRSGDELFAAIAEQLQLVLNHFSEPTDWPMREEFAKITRKLDVLRNESFAELFPELQTLV